VVEAVLLFLSSIPITILMNSFRVGTIGVMVEHWGVGMAEGFLHEFQGWAVFMVSGALMVLEMMLLARIGARNAKTLAGAVRAGVSGARRRRLPSRGAAGPGQSVCKRRRIDRRCRRFAEPARARRICPQRLSFAPFPDNRALDRPARSLGGNLSGPTLAR
jgi:hypothetical protein